MQSSNSILSKDKYLHLSKLGTEFNMSFSSHVTLGSRLIALDGINKKLLVLDMSAEEGNPSIIELDKINSVSIKKRYSSIKPGELNKRNFDDFLKSIDLQFEYKDAGRNFIVPFYDATENDPGQLHMLEKNARNWQLILSKMIVPKRKPANSQRPMQHAGTLENLRRS